MGIRLLKNISACLGAAIILCAGLPCINTYASEEDYPIIYSNVSEGNDPVIALTEDKEDYVVLPGDSLWKISELLWGDGNEYTKLAAANKDTVSDPDLIYPGMRLKTSQTGYIVRKEAKYGGMQMGKYSMDFPHSWKVGTMQSGNAFANFVLSGDGVIACLIQDKKNETASTVRNWQKCEQQIISYADENFKEQVSDLQFEHYRVQKEEGSFDELYLYSFTWHISPDYPSLTARVCAGLKLTEHIQAEFIGYAFDDYDIHSCTRYVTASFEEHYETDDNGKFTVNDSNMSIVPDTDWELKGMFNTFAYVDEFFTSALNSILGVEDTEKSTGKKLLISMKAGDESFTSLEGKEPEAENSYLYFLHLEQLDGLTCCSFVINGKENEEFHVLIQGSWDGENVPLQHLIIPRNSLTDDNFSNYYLQKQDINFDGKEDILIHEGYNDSNHGNWENYRGIIFDGNKFIYYPSFPDQLSFLEFDKKRMISNGQVGARQQYVFVYEVVNGEYEKTKELRYHISDTEETDDILYYYEKEKLVRSHIITNGYKQVRELYPDMDYWRDKG